MHLPRTLLQMAGKSWPNSGWQDSVLLLIDHQREYIDGGLPLQEGMRAVAEMRALLGQARAAGAPVIHVVHHGQPGAPLFDPDGPWVDIIAGLEPAAGEATLIKRLPNAFAGTPLRESLQETGRKHLVLAGFATHMCISATARAALDGGYLATVVAAACATRDLPEPCGAGVIPAATLHRAALAALADRFARIVPRASGLS